MLQEQDEALKLERGREGERAERADFESGARLSGENACLLRARCCSVQMFDRLVDIGAFKLGDRDRSLNTDIFKLICPRLREIALRDHAS